MTTITVLMIVFIAPALVVLIKNALWDLYYWQIKEYRLDRIWTAIRWDQVKINRSLNLIGIKFILFSTITLVFTVPILALIGIFLIYIIWSFQSFNFLQDAITKNLRRPSAKSPRNILILLLLILTIASLTIFISYPFLLIQRDFAQIGSSLNFSEYFLDKAADEIYILPDVYVLLGFLSLILLFLDLSMPFLIPIYVFLTSPISIVRRRLIIEKAKRKLKNMNPHLIIIGITGSQGKTTTKEMLAEVLAKKYKVAKTPENFNTSVGVASAVLSEINKDTEIFVAEMGAYKKGEIASSVSHFPPDIAVLTDIDFQHVGLFGTRKDLAKAKFEITQNLNKNQVAILNGDNSYCRKYSADVKNGIIFVASTTEGKKESKKLDDLTTDVFLAEKVKSNSKLTEFNVIDEDKESTTYKIENPNKHIVDLSLIVVSIAKRLGFTNKEVKKALENVKFPKSRLTFESGDNGYFILDDTYNSNRKGFLAALELLDKKAGEEKRILITNGILELGREKINVYKDLAKEIKNKVDILITNDSLLIEEVKHENDNVMIVKPKDTNDLLFKVRALANAGDYILLEGRLDPKIIKNLVSDKM